MVRLPNLERPETSGSGWLLRLPRDVRLRNKHNKPDRVQRHRHERKKLHGT